MLGRCVLFLLVYYFAARPHSKTLSNRHSLYPHSQLFVSTKNPFCGFLSASNIKSISITVSYKHYLFWKYNNVYYPPVGIRVFILVLSQTRMVLCFVSINRYWYLFLQSFFCLTVTVQVPTVAVNGSPLVS